MKRNDNLVDVELSSVRRCRSMRLGRPFIAACLIGLIAILLMPQFCFSQLDSKRRMITLAVATSGRAPVGTAQRWMQMLQEVGADRVSSRTDINEVNVEEVETASVTIVQVTGLIDKNKLHLPGGAFTINDKSGIRALLKRLKDDGVEVALAEKKAFGLTAEQLVGLHEKLAVKVEFNTAGENAGDVIRKIAGKTGLPFEFDAAARAAINGEEKIVDELNGISAGTALAASLRPLGLVLEPQRKQGERLSMRVIDSRSSRENWPIGWPIQRVPVQVVPQLFDTLPIEIRGFPMNTALNAIQKRAEVPFFYDQNSMAREGIELDKVEVNLSSKKISLMAATSRLLRQSKPQLWEEVRVDENGTPFLWITTRQ